MRREELNDTLLKERLTTLKFIEPENEEEQKRIVGEIKYLEALLNAKERNELCETRFILLVRLV